MRKTLLAAAAVFSASAFALTAAPVAAADWQALHGVTAAPMQAAEMDAVKGKLSLVELFSSLKGFTATETVGTSTLLGFSSDGSPVPVNGAVNGSAFRFTFFKIVP